MNSQTKPNKTFGNNHVAKTRTNAPCQSNQNHFKNRLRRQPLQNKHGFGFFVVGALAVLMRNISTKVGGDTLLPVAGFFFFGLWPVIPDSGISPAQHFAQRRACQRAPPLISKEITHARALCFRHLRGCDCGKHRALEIPKFGQPRQFLDSDVSIRGSKIAESSRERTRPFPARGKQPAIRIVSPGPFLFWDFCFWVLLCVLWFLLRRPIESHAFCLKESIVANDAFAPSGCFWLAFVFCILFWVLYDISPPRRVFWGLVAGFCIVPG